MSAQEGTQEDTITGSSQISSSVERQKLITRERNRLRQLIYRRRRRQKEVELRENYQQLESNYRTMEINYHLATKQNILLAIEAQEYKVMCQRLITNFINHHTVPERRGSEIEYIISDDREEIREEIVNEAPSFTLENSNEIRNGIDDMTIQHGDTTMSAFNWASMAPDEFK